MKRFLRPEFVIIGTAALALLGWSTISAAAGVRDHRAVPRQVAVESEPSAAPTAPPTAEPQAENEPTPDAENEAVENENEIAEPAEEANEPAENENENEAPAPPTAAPTPMTSSRTFDLIGGTVTFTCTGSSISLTSAVPAAGFQMETGSEDGGREIEVKFESDTHKSEIRAACVGGQIVAAEIQEESD